MTTRVKCWEHFGCGEPGCPVYGRETTRCWLETGTRCHGEVQQQFSNKMELCLVCEIFKQGMDDSSAREAVACFLEQLKSRSGGENGLAQEMTASFSEIYDLLARLSKGDPTVRVPLAAGPEFFGTLKVLLNQLAESMQEMIEDSNDMAIGICEHYYILNRISSGDFTARAAEESQNELIAKLGALINREADALTSAIERLEKAETALRAQFHFLRVLIDTIPSPVFYKDAAGRYLGCNRAFESCVGLSQEELVGKTAHQLWSGEQADGYRQKDLELFENPGVQVYETSAMYSDGTLHDVIINKATFNGKDGSLGGLVGVMLDITEHKRAEAENRRLEAQLHHSRMMETVMIQLGHDLKTPLTPLFALLPLIGEKGSDPGLKRMVDICLKSAGHIKELSDKTLKFARLSAMAAPAAREDIALASALNAIIADCAEMSARNVTCENAIDPEIVVPADPDQLNELFANLISNAVRYSPEHGVIRVAAAQTEDTVTVSVQDNGIGLAPEHLEHIFEEFFKADESRHDLTAPGLGLSVCKRVVHNHKGRIWAESPGTGKGTTILFTLPRCAA